MREQVPDFHRLNLNIGAVMVAHMDNATYTHELLEALKVAVVCHSGFLHSG